ncbi:transaldolase [Candidatus Nomurabacteria bacterium]|nr:transaldolase [Candidatus Nomurabacteria bacterium]
MHISDTSTKIFLDSGDPSHTQEVLARLGFLDGQTTNPSLVAQSEIIKELQAGGKLSQDQLLAGYQSIVERIHNYIPNGSISIEVYADANTTAQEMIDQAHTMRAWLPNPHIKLPITVAGLEAARQLVDEGTNVNMTLCFTQGQAWAVHLATLGAKPGQVCVSPFIGRLDDRGIDGVSLVKNISQMYREAGSHVAVLAASIRSLEHISLSVYAGADILTIPYKLFAPWAEHNFTVMEDMSVDMPEREMIEYQNLDTVTNWHDMDITHELTDTGLQKFADDWNAIMS